MSNNPEEKPDTGNVSDGSPNRRRNRTAIVAMVGVLAITAIAIILWLLLRPGSSGAGRPVPTPRNIGAEPSASTSPTSEATISIDPEAAKRAGIKTEAVGEAMLAGGTTTGQVTTGVGQANGYRTSAGCFTRRRHFRRCRLTGPKRKPGTDGGGSI